MASVTDITERDTGSESDEEEAKNCFEQKQKIYSEDWGIQKFDKFWSNYS